jgi:transcriptional regulator with XRE-family HTH domain
MRVDPSTDIRDFLISRRARVSPEQAGLPDFGYGGKRRVQGLRREEVAMLSGISVEYYTRLERGKATGVSHEVLDAIARTLQLHDAERAHLFDLVRTAATGRPARRPSQERVRPAVQRILDSMPAIPAYVRNGRLDILAANQLGKAVYSQVFLQAQAQAPNMARFIFLSPQAREFFTSWEGIASDAAARRQAGAPTTAAYLTSSASCPPAATNSGSAGPPTTSSSTAPAPSSCTTR